MQKTATPHLTDADRETIRRFTDEARRQEEALAAKVDRTKQAFLVQFAAADGAEPHVKTIYAANEEQALRMAENLAYQEHIKHRFVKVWPQ